MKKLLLSLLTIAASFTASAESITALFGSADNANWDNTTGYTTLVESKDGLWAHQNFHNNKNGWGYIKCGRKNVASIGSIYTNTSRTEKIKEVVVTIDAVTSASVNNAALYISADKTNWGNAYKTVTSVSKGDLTFTIDNPQADLYYKVSFDCKASSNNGIVQVSKFTLNYDAEDPDKASCGLAYETTEFAVAADQTFEKPTLTNPNELPVYYVSSNNNVATVNALTGDVTLTGIAGKTIISANFDGNDTFNPGSATYTLNVTSAPYHTLKDLVTKGQDGEEFTAVGNFAVLYQKDKYLLLTDGTSNVLAFFNSTITSYEVGTPISAINGKVTIFNGLFEITDFTLTEGGEGAEINPTEITSLSGISPENNLFDLVTVTGDISNVNGSNATLTVGEETIALFNRFTLENFANCASATVTGFVWVYNGTRQICPNAIVEPEKKADAELSFDGQASYELILGYNVSSFVAPKLNNPNGVTVTYSSSNEAIAIVDETTGDILLEDAEGTATITATFEGDDTYEAATVSYTIVIKAPEACATPTFSATAIYAGESVTITSTEGSTISYMINDGDVMEGLSPVTITFSEVGTYEIYASASKDGYNDSEDVIETITVSEQPEGDLAITAAAFNMSGTAYAAYTFKSDVTNVTYAAKASVNSGIQINTAATSNATKSGITITDNPDGLIIAKIIIRTNAAANGKIKDIEFSNTPGVLTTSTTAKEIAVGFPENTVTVSVSPEISSDNKTFTFTPTDDFKYFLLTSSAAIQITGFDVLYKKPAVVEPVTPAAPVVLVNGNDVEDFESPIDLQQGSVEITLTAEEGHHIYHKHVEAPEEAIYFDGEAEEDIHAGFTHVPTHSATLTVNKNGTLTYYAFNPETQLKSEPVSLSFVNASTTSISEVEVENADVRCYDLQGRRVANPSRGLFIVNGKKVIR